jgi:dipeptidyl aminopeptidase/acylaminoacyl peptidase
MRAWMRMGPVATPRAVVPALLLVALAVTAVATAAQPRPMTIVDLIDLPGLGEPQLSPDGRAVLYTRTDADWKRNDTFSALWRVGADGTDPVRLTHGEHGESGGRWSPDGRWIAFTARRGEARTSQIFLLPTDGGEARALTSHPTSPSAIEWSPDGRWVYFLADDEKTADEKAREQVNDNVFAFDENWKHRHVWRADPATGSTERVTEGEFTVRGYRLSRDGTLLLHSRAPTPLLDDGPRAELYVMPAGGGDATRLTDNAIAEVGFSLSPDNRTILFVANSNADFDYYYNSKIFTMPAGGGRPELLLPDLPWEVNAAEWSADGRAVYFLANTGVRQNLYRADVRTRQVAAVTAGDQTVGGWTYDARLRQHVFTVNDAANAGDVWVLAEAANARPRRVTAVFDDLGRRFRLPRQEAIRWAGADGVEVEGLLYWPLDYEEGRRYPLVVQTHGGPAASDKFSFGSAANYVQVLSSLGYFVFRPNYRGSTGYGDDFLRDMVGSYFNQSHLDVMTGVDHLIERGLVDGERMAKMGWSAGGHMTNKIITHTDRFRAASSGAGAVNWISMYGTSDTRVYRTPWFGGTPWQKDAPIDKYLEASPLFDIHRVTTPTIVLVGENDERVPMSQSVELFRALRSVGVPSHLYIAPRQGHGWRELQQRLFKANVELAWFERWVTGRDYTWERSPVHPQPERVRAASDAVRSAR